MKNQKIQSFEKFKTSKLWKFKNWKNKIKKTKIQSFEKIQNSKLWNIQKKLKNWKIQNTKFWEIKKLKI